jgi:hypothetical protein
MGSSWQSNVIAVGKLVLVGREDDNDGIALGLALGLLEASVVVGGIDVVGAMDAMRDGG